MVSPAPAVLMSVNMLIETEGRNYTWSEYPSMASSSVASRPENQVSCAVAGEEV